MTTEINFEFQEGDDQSDASYCAEMPDGGTYEVQVMTPEVYGGSKTHYWAWFHAPGDGEATLLSEGEDVPKDKAFELVEADADTRYGG